MAYTEVMQKQIYTDFNRLRLAHQHMAVALDVKLFLTLATNQSMSLERIKRKTREFLARMDAKMLKHGWSKAPASERLDGLLYVEHEHSNIHVHGLMTKPYCNYAGLQLRAEEIWSELCESGSVVIKPVGDVRKRSEYCTKEAGKHGFFERQFFMASEFMAAA
jgi:predicted small integral membrane protein